jgi:hypothetical protein
LNIAHAIENAVLDEDIKLSLLEGKKMFALALINSVLKYHRNNYTKAAESLGIPRPSLMFIIGDRKWSHAGFLIRKRRAATEAKRLSQCPLCRCVSDPSLAEPSGCYGCLAIEEAVNSAIYSSQFCT